MRIPISIFGRSESFDDAYSNYSTFINPFLKDMTEKNIIEVLEAIRDNGQIRCCYKVQDKFHILKATAVKLNPDFDFSRYEFIK